MSWLRSLFSFERKIVNIDEFIGMLVSRESLRKNLQESYENIMKSIDSMESIGSVRTVKERIKYVIFERNLHYLNTELEENELNKTYQQWKENIHHLYDASFETIVNNLVRVYTLNTKRYSNLESYGACVAEMKEIFIHILRNVFSEHKILYDNYYEFRKNVDKKINSMNNFCEILEARVKEMFEEEVERRRSVFLNTYDTADFEYDNIPDEQLKKRFEHTYSFEDYCKSIVGRP